MVLIYAIKSVNGLYCIKTNEYIMACKLNAFE